MIDAQVPQHLRVLCIDDDPDIRLIVELSLHLDPDIQALSVSSASEGVSELKTRVYDLVLLDSKMPDKDGFAFLDEITKPDGSPPTPIIFLTADTADRDRYVRQGVLGVLFKPFDPITLADRVRALFTKAVSLEPGSGGSTAFPLT